MKRIVPMLLLLCLLTAGLTACQEAVEPTVEATATPVSAAPEKNSALADYMTSVESQSNAIKVSLAQEELTQTEMNLKSGELCDLWDAAMNRMLEEAKKALPAADLATLMAEQDAWAEAAARAAEAAGAEFAGGSMAALAANSELAKLIEARVYELYARLK